MNSAQFWRNCNPKPLIFWLPFTVLTTSIFIASSVPGNALPTFSHPWTDKVLHCCAFFVYGLSTSFALLGAFPRWRTLTVALVTLFVGAIWGGIDEVHQMFVANREASVVDWLADLTGILLSLPVIRRLRSFIF